MTVPLLLVGAGGLAREAAEAARATGRYALLGFLDDDPRLAGTVRSGLPVLGPVDAVHEHPDAAVLLCPGRGGARLRLAERLRQGGLADDRWASVVHPSASVPASCTVGPGAVLLAGVVLTADVRLGRHVAVMPGAVLTHDDVLADGVTVCARVALAGGVEVREGAYLGAGALVREDLVVGAWSVVGMGAVVLADVPDGVTVAGCPARPLPGPQHLARAADRTSRTSTGRQQAGPGETHVEESA